MVISGDFSVSNILSCVEILKFANKTNTKISPENILSYLPQITNEFANTQLNTTKFSFSEIDINSLKKCLK